MPDVVMVSGVSGFGEDYVSAFTGAARLCALSIDRIMWSRHGMCGRDYPEEKFADYLAEAESELLQRLDRIIKGGGKAVLDFTFCKRGKRDAYREFVASRGRKTVLIYCDTPLSTIKERLHRRNLHPSPDAAIVTDEMAERFFSGFQRPGDDEECIIHLSLAKGEG